MQYTAQRDSEECDQCAVRDSSVCAPQVCALGAASLVERERGGSAERAGALYRSHFSAHTLSCVHRGGVCVSQSQSRYLSSVSLSELKETSQRAHFHSLSRLSVSIRAQVKVRLYQCRVSRESTRHESVSLESVVSLGVCSLSLSVVLVCALPLSHTHCDV
jgi:hypothetical protein